MKEKWVQQDHLVKDSAIFNKSYNSLEMRDLAGNAKYARGHNVHL